MSVYIISSRPVKKTANPKKEVFSKPGSDRAQANFRIARCDVSEDNKKIDYTILKDIGTPDYNKVVKVLSGAANVSSLGGTEAMFYDLYKSMSTDPNRADVLFFIHGFATSFDDELEHILLLKKLYIDNPDCPTQHLIYLSWPTSDNMALTYWSDKEDSIVTGQALARIYVKLNNFFHTMFRKYNEESCGQKIHLMAHSMGNQVLKQTMGSLAEKYIVPFLGEIILVHADVSSDSFEKNQPLAKLEKLGQRTHIYVNKSDDALTISTTTKNFSKRLGKTGPTNLKELEGETFVIDVTGLKCDTESDSFFEKLKIRIGDHWGYMYSKDQVEDIIRVLKGVDERRIAHRKRHDLFPNYFYLGAENITEVQR
ncbi:alpha/beta hydrolase [Flavobacterium sp. RHBU_24]|uniref:alpha/beta hydrolase n=1 Tax=Flavobacterium sp. RHBU_24 TaxID=3391185 RepID=UPI0039855F89